jgi:hypothetical protein
LAYWEELRNIKCSIKETMSGHRGGEGRTESLAKKAALKGLDRKAV